MKSNNTFHCKCSPFGAGKPNHLSYLFIFAKNALLIIVLIGLASCNNLKYYNISSDSYSEYVVGGGGVYERYYVDNDKRLAVWEHIENGKIIKKTSRSISVSEMAQYLDSLNSIGIEQWLKLYESSDRSKKPDYTAWSITIKNHLTQIRSEGVNAYPADDSPSNVIVDQGGDRYTKVYKLFSAITRN